MVLSLECYRVNTFGCDIFNKYQNHFMCTCELYTCSLFDASVGNDFSGGHACGLLWVEACLAIYMVVYMAVLFSLWVHVSGDFLQQVCNIASLWRVLLYWAEQWHWNQKIIFGILVYLNKRCFVVAMYRCVFACPDIINTFLGCIIIVIIMSYVLCEEVWLWEYSVF